MSNIKQGYKQTDIGVIPEDWEIAEIEDICKSIVRGPFGGALKKEYFVNSGFKVYEQRNAIYQNVNIGRYYIDSDKFSALKRFEITYKDFIVSCSGTIGRIYQIPKKFEKGIINQALLKLTIDEAKCDNKYFYYVFVSNEFQQKIIDSTQGGAMKNLVGMPIFKKTTFALSKSIAEQTAIATALSDTDALIAALDKKIAKKQQIKQGAMQQLLTGKKRLPGFSGKWVEKKLGAIGKTYGGLTGKTKDDFGNGDSYYITFLNILNNPVINTDLIERVRIKSTEHQNKALKNDLFFNTSSETPEEVGICSVLLNDIENLYLNSFCFGYRINDNEVHGLFLSYLFRSKQGRELMTSLAQGATRYNLSKSLFNQSLIKMPATKTEQTAIAQILTDMDNEIAQLEKERDKYKELKAGMMQVLLTGKVRFV